MRKFQLQSLLIAGVAGLGVGCTSPISISDQTGPWANNSQYFQSNLTIDDDVEIIEAWVSYARHYWPDPALANRVEAEPVNPGSASTQWRALVPDSGSFWQADSLFYVWGVQYRTAYDPDIRTAYSAGPIFDPHRRVVGCTQASTDATLNQIFQTMTLLKEQSVDSIHPSYAQSPAHLGPVSLKDQGVTYSHTGTVLGTVANIHDERYRNMTGSLP